MFFMYKRCAIHKIVQNKQANERIKRGTPKIIKFVTSHDPTFVRETGNKVNPCTQNGHVCEAINSPKHVYQMK